MISVIPKTSIVKEKFRWWPFAHSIGKFFLWLIGFSFFDRGTRAKGEHWVERVVKGLILRSLGKHPKRRGNLEQKFGVASIRWLLWDTVEQNVMIMTTTFGWCLRFQLCFGCSCHFIVWSWTLRYLWPTNTQRIGMYWAHSRALGKFYHCFFPRTSTRLSGFLFTLVYCLSRAAAKKYLDCVTKELSTS